MKVEIILTVKYYPNLQMQYYYWSEALLELSVLSKNTAWWTQPRLAHSWNVRSGLKPTDQLLNHKAVAFPAYSCSRATINYFFIIINNFGKSLLQLYHVLKLVLHVSHVVRL